MIILIDQGNTRLKAWLVHEQRVIAALPNQQPQALLSWYHSLASKVEPESFIVSGIYVASVCTQEAKTALSKILAPLTSGQVMFAQVDNTLLPTIYNDPTRLGTDRWLALLACRHEGDVVVIDAGTAFTVDVLSAQNRHEGGYILPGLGLQREALAQGTAQVKFTQGGWSSLALGKDTASCVENGSLLSLVALVQHLVARLVAQTGHLPKLVLTGGDAPYFLPYLPEAQHRPLLVVEGLACAFGQALQVT